MAQISKGDTFVDGQQVTGARLNQLVDSAVLLVGSISDQTAIAANGVAAGDELPINDSGVLKKTTAGDILNSGLSITTGSISGNTGADLVVTPSVGQKIDIAGNLEADDLNVTNDLTVGNDATVSGDLLVTGSSTLTGNVIADNGFTSNGTANFTGVFQFNGSSVYALSEIIEESIPNATGVALNTLHNLFTSASYTKPVNELWVVEVTGIVYQANNTLGHWRMTDSTDTIIYVSHYWNSATSNDTIPFHFNFYLPSSNTHSGTFVFRFKSYQQNITISPSAAQLSSYPDSSKRTDGKFRIYKYKTA